MKGYGGPKVPQCVFVCLFVCYSFNLVHTRSIFCDLNARVYNCVFLPSPEPVVLQYA